MKAVVVNPEGTGVEIVANKEVRPLETGEALVQIEYWNRYRQRSGS